MKHNIMKNQNGSVLVECMAALTVLAILSLVIAKTLLLSNSFMAKSEKLKNEIYSSRLYAEQNENVSVAENVELTFTFENGSQAFVPAQMHVFGKDGARLCLILPEEKDYENEDAVLE